MSIRKIKISTFRKKENDIEKIHIHAKVSADNMETKEAMCDIELKAGESVSIDCVGDIELLKKVSKLKLIRETIGELPEITE